MQPQPCSHLQPLVDHLRERGLELTPCPSPYGDVAYAWWAAPCVFEAVPALRERLALAASLTYVERFDFAAGADATWTCVEHRCVLIGPHPRNASADVPRVGA